MEADRVLVLNQTLEPLHVCGARRAVILLFTGKAERVEDGHRVLRSPSLVFVIPSVIRLHRYINRPVRPAISFTKKNILKRDAYTCQYCGRNGGERMTIHVEVEPGCDPAVSARIRRKLHDLLALSPEVRLVKLGELERPQGKAVRVVDRRTVR